MASHGLYAVQVRSGEDERACSLLKRVVDEDLYDEVFVPHYVKMIHRQGVWRPSKELLLPGYLLISTTDAASLSDALREVPAYARILHTEEGYKRLPKVDVDWLFCLTAPGDRTVGFSRGMIANGRTIVTEGPLTGHEGEIVKIDRRKRLAFLDLSVSDQPRRARVGLEIFSKT